MSGRSRNNHTRKLITAICALFLASTFAVAHQTEPAKAITSSQEKLDPSLFSATGDTRVYILLKSNDLAASADEIATKLASSQRSAGRAAQRIALSNPNILTPAERREAARVEQAHNSALALTRNAAEKDVSQSETIHALIVQSGGEVEQATPLPNSITARISPALLIRLADRDEVASIAPAGPPPELMNSPVDGSETWHTNGYIGDGPSADGNGGPDFALVDAGVRTTHLAFRSRLVSDPPDGPATGPSRITSSPSRTDFSGSEHGNVIAATVANTDLTQPVWPYHKGLAYGVDKVYDPHQAKSGWHWLHGISYLGEAGVSDLPEALNYSSGIYEDTVDTNPIFIYFDNYIATLGTTYSISAGNCGVEGGGYSGCSVLGQGPHRVSSPANLYNVIAVGGLNADADPYNSTTWVGWANSSPGPTWGGRKKPVSVTTQICRSVTI